MSSEVQAHYICRHNSQYPISFYTELAERLQREVFPSFSINPSFVSERYRNLVAGLDSSQCFVTGSIDYHGTIGDRFGKNMVAVKKLDIQRKSYRESIGLYHRDRERYESAKVFAQKYISFAYVGNSWHSDLDTRPHSDAAFLVAVDVAKQLRSLFQLPIHTICFTTMGLDYSAYSFLEAYHRIRRSQSIVERDVWKEHVLPWQRVTTVYQEERSVLRDLESVMTSFDLPEELADIRRVQQKYGGCS